MSDPVERTPDGYKVRLRYGKGLRGRFLIRTLDDAVAERRAARLRDLAALLSRSGHSAHAFTILTEAAGAQNERDFADYCKVGEDLCGAGARAPKARSTMTVRQLGEAWTGGELTRLYPDQVKEKRTKDDDESRFENYIYPLLESKLVVDVTLDDAEEIMRRLPADLAPLTRRGVGAQFARLLKLAVYPLRIIERSPIPAGFLPHRGQRKALAYLYPDEDRRLCECADVPFAFRLLWGFLTREGMREGEAMALTWADIDLKRGAVRLDKNKTDDPRAWALDAGTAEALRLYKEHFRPKAEPDELVFIDPTGEPHTKFGAAALLRSHLKAVGLERERPELFASTPERRQIRAHDLRGTFVTVALANGRSEAWISDRTGHRSSAMIAKYKRTARTVSELGLGALVPLVDALPELRLLAATERRGPGDASQGGPAVGQRSRIEQERGRPQRDSNGGPVVSGSHEEAVSRTSDTPSDTAEQPGPRSDGGWASDGVTGNARVGQTPDPIEVALADALTGAVAAGQWDAVQALTSELRARREARAQVVSLDAARQRRERGDR